MQQAIELFRARRGQGGGSGPAGRQAAGRVARWNSTRRWAAAARSSTPPAAASSKTSPATSKSSSTILLLRLPRWRRWLCRAWCRRAREILVQRMALTHRDIFDSLVEGYDLILGRLQRAMKKAELYRIECVGQTVDPNLMTVVEVVDDPLRPPGLVVEEMRPGYYWKDKVFRFAEVRAVQGRTAVLTTIRLTTDSLTLTTTMETILGIDLGTTNSEVAIIRNGKAEVLYEDGEAILPSVVGLDADGRLLVGAAARNQWVLAPERTVRSIKRRMGTAETVRLGDQAVHAAGNLGLHPAEAEGAGREAARPARAARPSSPCPPSSTRRSARRPARRASWPAWKSSASSTSRPPPRSPTTRIPRRWSGCWSTISAAAPSTSRSCRSSRASWKCSAATATRTWAATISTNCSWTWSASDFQREHGVDLRQSPAAKSRVLRAVEEAKKRLSAGARRPASRKSSSPRSRARRCTSAGKSAAATTKS